MAGGFRMPRRNAIAVIVALLWAVTFGAARDVVWADLKTGLLTTKGLSRTTRFLIWAALVLVGVMILMLLFGETFRGVMPLHPLLGGSPYRGTLIPQYLLPITLFVFGAGTAFMLVGALHLRPALRAVALVPLLAVAGSWLAIVRGLADGWQEVTVEAALVAVPVFYVIRWRAKPRPIFEFVVFLTLITAVLAIAQDLLLEADRLSGLTDFAFTQTSNVVLDLNTLVLPLLFMIGVDVAEFAQRTSAWGVTIVRDRLWSWAPMAALAGFGSWSAFVVIRDVFERLDVDSGGDVLGGYVGALMIPILIGTVWWVCTRWSATDDEDGAAALPHGEITVESLAESARGGGARLTGAYLGLPLLMMVGVMGVQVMLAFDRLSTDDLARLLRFTTRVAGQANAWRIIVDVLALGVGLWIARRGKGTLGLYLAAVGIVDVWFQLTTAGRPLEQLAWRGHGPEELWWTALVLGAGVVWALGRRLSDIRVEALLFVLVLLEVSRLTKFLDDPYSAVFPIGGAAFIAVGVAWDLGSAGSWANEGTTRAPRISRIFLYVGYVLFAVTLVNWSLSSHDVAAVEIYTGGGALLGFELLGRPLLYTMMAAALAAAFGSWRVVMRPTQVPGEAGPTGDAAAALVPSGLAGPPVGPPPPPPPPAPPPAPPPSPV